MSLNEYRGMENVRRTPKPLLPIGSRGSRMDGPRLGCSRCRTKDPRDQNAFAAQMARGNVVQFAQTIGPAPLCRVRSAGPIANNALISLDRPVGASSHMTSGAPRRAVMFRDHRKVSRGPTGEIIAGQVSHDWTR